MFIPVGTAVAAVEVADDENCYCTKCFFRGTKVCKENPCNREDRPDGKNVVYMLVNYKK